MTADSGGYILVEFGPSLWVWAAAAIVLALAAMCIGLILRRGRRGDPTGRR
jgi:hypothetical protein